MDAAFVMPYEIKPVAGGYVVINSETGRPHSKKPLSRTRAKAQMRALYANVPDAAKAAAEETTAPAGRKPMTPAERARHASLVRWGKEQPFAARLEGLRQRRKAAKQKKASGKGKAKKPAPPTPEQRAAEQDKAAAEARAKVFSEMGLPEDAAGALSDLMAGADTDDDGGLVKLGLAEMGKDGTLRLTSAGRALHRAASRGDLGAAKDAASRGRDKAATQAERETEKQAREQEKAEREKSKGSGGGSKKEKKKPAKEEPSEEADEPATDDEIAAETAAEVGIEEEELSFLRGAADGDLPPGSFDASRLMALGLIEDTGDEAVATAEGVEALAALESGNPKRYRAAVRRGKARMRRDEAQAGREKEREKQRKEKEEGSLRERARRTQEGDMRRQERTAERERLSKAQQDRRVAAEVDRIAAARARKAVEIKQSAQDRAMFANMGSSGGSGGGRGGKPTGGQGGLYKQNADGERTPQAGFEVKPKKKRAPISGDREAEARFRKDKLEKAKAKTKAKLDKTRAKKQRLAELETEVRGGGLSLARLKEIRAELAKLRSTKAIEEDSDMSDYTPLIEDLEALKAELEEVSDPAIKAGKRNNTADQALINEGYALSESLCELFEQLGADVGEEEEGYEEGGEVEMLEGKAETVYGSEVKALAGDAIGGYAVLFGAEDTPDMSAHQDYFTAKTDYWLDRFGWPRPMTYHHAMDEDTRDEPIVGVWNKAVVKDEGIWLEGQLDRAHRYHGAIKELIKRGYLKLSSDSAPQWVVRERKPSGAHEVKRWPLLTASPTVTPAEPRMLGLSFKALMTELGLDDIDNPEVDGGDAARSDETKAADALRSRKLLLLTELELAEAAI